MVKPLVSILVPAYNAERWIAETLQSAIAQTWSRKEIIVVDDGSKDQTGEIAQRFGSKGVAVVSTENQGVGAARNLALHLSKGDFIQWLDADDLLAPDKIERQLTALREINNNRILASCAWAHFYFRTRHVRFAHNSLCKDLSPVEWLLRKMGENLHMANATWLTSRELADAAGPFDTTLAFDDDGEYFCRVLLASEGTRFVPGTGMFYRVSGTASTSYIGTSDKKRESLLRSMKLHMQYLRSLEESERVRQACLTYLQNWYVVFYPDRKDLIAELQALAKQLGGCLTPPRLGRHYAWLTPIIGYKATKGVQEAYSRMMSSSRRSWDEAMYKLETRKLNRNLDPKTGLSRSSLPS